MTHDEHIRHRDDKSGSHLKNAMKHMEHHKAEGHHMVERHALGDNVQPMGSAHLQDHVPPTAKVDMGPGPKGKIPADSTGN